MLKVKCGREEFELDSSDLVMFNGSCYQIVTQKIQKGWDRLNPIIAKSRAEKLIREGSLVEANTRINMGIKLIYFKIAN